MDKNKFITAVNTRFVKECDELKSLEAKNYVFSDRFEKNMKKIFKKVEEK